MRWDARCRACCKTATDAHALLLPGAKTYLSTLRVSRGMSWDAALAFRKKVFSERAADGLPRSSGSGFYKNMRVTNQGQTGARHSKSACSLQHLSPGPVH